MVTTTAWISKQNNPLVQSGFATIDSGATATLAIPCGGRGLVRLGIPSTFTGTALTFTVQPFPPANPASPTIAPPFRTLKDGAGNTVSKVIGANQVVEVPELSGVYAFTIVSNATEEQADAIEVQMVGETPFPFDASAAASAAAAAFPSAFPRTAPYTKANLTAATAWTTGNSPQTLFTVTGNVLMQVYAVVTTGITSTGATGTLSVGVTGNTACLLPLTTMDGSNFPTGAVWTDSSPTLKAESLGDAYASVLVANTNVIVTIATNSVTAGGIIVYCRWVPISAGATVA